MTDNNYFKGFLTDKVGTLFICHHFLRDAAYITACLAFRRIECNKAGQLYSATMKNIHLLSTIMTRQLNEPNN
jgi:hypothetical protein